MALRGALQEVNLADICQLLALGRKTGCLWLTDRSRFGYIYFEQGKVNYANVLNRPDRLGVLLLQNGIVTQAQLDEAARRQADSPDTRMGQVLIGMGCLTEDQLARYVTQQVSEAVYHLFTWSSGSFQFEPDKKPDEEEARLVSINAENLLLEGARRVDEWSQIEKRIPSFDLIFRVTRVPTEADGELSSSVRKALPLIDGNRTVSDLVGASGLSDFEAGKALFELLNLGLIEQAGQREPDAGASDDPAATHLDLGAAFGRAGMVEDAIREFRNVVELDPDNAKAHAQLATLELTAGRPEEALEHFNALPAESQRTYAALRNRSLALEQLGRHGEALKLLDQVEAARPGDGEVFLARAITQMKAGMPSQASDSIRRYRERLGDGSPPAVYFAHAVLIHAMDGDLPGAVRLGREGLGQYPHDPSILVNAGAVLERSGEPAAAKALYERAVQSATAPVPAQAYKSLGDLAWVNGDMDTARACYEQAVHVDPRLGPDVYVRLGDIAQQAGNEAAARECWQNALALDPQHSAASDRMGSATPVAV